MLWEPRPVAFTWPPATPTDTQTLHQERAKDLFLASDDEMSAFRGDCCGVVVPTLILFKTTHFTKNSRVVGWHQKEQSHWGMRTLTQESWHAVLGVLNTNGFMFQDRAIPGKTGQVVSVWCSFQGKEECIWGVLVMGKLAPGTHANAPAPRAWQACPCHYRLIFQN